LPAADVVAHSFTFLQI